MTSRVSTVDETSPPVTTVASGRWTSAPTPVAKSNGASPSAVVIPPIDIKKSLISAAKNIGAGHIHPHQFRHTCATRLKDQGAPMEHIMALGGWKSSMTAKRYARVNPVHLLQQHADRLEERPGHTPDDTKSKPTLP